MDNEIDFEEGETNKERQEKIKNVLADCTCMHELPAKSFYKADLDKNLISGLNGIVQVQNLK